MARYIQEFYLNQPNEFVYVTMNDFLQKNGFAMSTWKGEPAYQAGDPFFEGYKYLNWSYNNGMFHLEAWIRGIFGGEWDLDGFVGCAIKGPYKDKLIKLITSLYQPIPQDTPVQAPNAQTASTGAPNAGSSTVAKIPAQITDNHNAATLALTFGILSLVFCWIPLVSIFFPVMGLMHSRMGIGSSKSGRAKAGKICCIIALSIMTIVTVLIIRVILLNVMASLT